MLRFFTTKPKSDVQTRTPLTDASRGDGSHVGNPRHPLVAKISAIPAHERTAAQSNVLSESAHTAEQLALMTKVPFTTAYRRR